AGCEHHLEGDPARPLFTRIVSPARKVLGDNPDALYFWSRIEGARSYRIRGALDGAVYTSFTVHGVDPEGGSMERIIGDLNDDALTIGPDGTYELVLSPTPHAGNWIRLEPDATAVITRHYFERPLSVAADPDATVRLRIDALEPPPPPAPWSDAALAARLDTVRRFVRANTLGMPAPGQGPDHPFVSKVPNQLPPPSSFRASGVTTLGAVDVHYAMAPWLLQPDQALVMEGRLPPCRFANVVLWNMHMQTLDYRSRRTSLNRAQMRLGADGAFRIAIAHRDPGVPDWLDTEAHPIGIVFWRIVLPESEPEVIRCTVVPES
ncbi:MAG TPA: hypothetical protein VLV15_10065, partial [Dongiaceae bacterium]|nr:hypothetical protein [Dongiaceae bacterium]